MTAHLLPHDTPRLRLHRLRQQDLAHFQAYRGDPELRRYQGWSPLHDAAQIGFTLARSAQGHGLGTEAVTEAMERVFPHTPATRVVSITDARNSASASAFFDRHGFSAAAFSDGSGNAERRPDVLYHLPCNAPEAAPAALPCRP